MFPFNVKENTFIYVIFVVYTSLCWLKNFTLRVFSLKNSWICQRGCLLYKCNYKFKVTRVYFNLSVFGISYTYVLSHVFYFL